MKFISISQKLPSINEDILIVEKSTNGDFIHYDLGYMYLNNSIPTFIKRATNINVEDKNWKVIGYYELKTANQIIFEMNKQVVKCKHPKEKRTFIGSNLLKCGVCGEEFS